jgi:hypothetical protein
MLLLFAEVNFSFAQPVRLLDDPPPYIARDHAVYQLEIKMQNGDKSALLKIAPFFDSTRKVSEPLGYHLMHTSVANIARRIVEENCFFLDDEFKITDSTAGKQFAVFLRDNYDKITFSPLSAAFQITGLDERSVKYEIRAVSENKKKELQKESLVLLTMDWVRQNGIDVMIAEKNPTALLTIASELLRTRNRYDRYTFNEKEYLHLLQYLTGMEIGVEDGRGQITWHIDRDYYPQSRLNLLIYFAKNYAQYAWDDSLAVFINPKQKIIPVNKEQQLFELLSSKNDTIALDAFTRLTLCDKEEVTRLANEYFRANIDRGYGIPTFPYQFLKQLVLLVDYCRKNNIDFSGNKQLQVRLGIQNRYLPFAQQRKIEDDLIATLPLDEITALEYWSIIYENKDQSFSPGRVLDIFYSRNWDKLLADDKQLDCYLKKSALFNRLGIIGTCGSYLKKFTDASPATLARLAAFHSADTDVNRQIEKVILMNKQPKTNQ